MKLLHVITSLYTGGAETLVVNMVPRFQALGHEVGVVVFNGGHTPLMERLEKECPNCKLYKLGDSFYNPWYIIKLVKIMRDYDIVHTHNSSPQLYAAIANLFCRKKLVTTEHNTNNRKRGNCLLFSYCPIRTTRVDGEKPTFSPSSDCVQPRSSRMFRIVEPKFPRVLSP